MRIKFDFLQMEELLKHPILAIYLSQTFNLQQWKLITQESPLIYQQRMRAIFRLLDQQLPSLTNQFSKFVQNHQTLKNWHQENPTLRSSIEPYIFKAFKLDPSRTNLRQHYGKTSAVKKMVRTQPSAVRKFFAETLAMSEEHKSLQVQTVNSYELYMETFSACRGKRYAAYDYEKHMKSSQQKSKYNEFIRLNHKRNLSIPNHRKKNSLQGFEEWHLSHSKKSSLVNVRKILSDLSLNNEKGINNLLKRQGATKLVLLNHQRKPINYYLRTSGKPCPGPSI